MAGRTCTICSHEKRAEIEMSIASSVSYRHISSQFGVGYKSVERHANDGHIAQEIKQSHIAVEEARSLDVVQQLKYINSIAVSILQKAMNVEDKEWLALQAMDRVMKQLELQSKLLGDIDTPQINIILMPEWIRIRTTLVQALIPFPDARIAVASALVRMESDYAVSVS